MSPRRRPSITEQITDPGVPLMFLFGTVLLAVLGNAVYDLLVSALGSGLLPLALLTVGTLGLLGLISAGLWLWFRARSGQLTVEVRPGRALEVGYPGLVLFVSERREGAERAAIERHIELGALQRLWLIVSPEAGDSAAELERWLQREPGGSAVEVTKLPLGDAFEAADAYTAVQTALELAGDLIDRTIVDITSGTKFMSVGAVLACRDYGVPMEYVRVPYEEGRPRTDLEATIMKVEL
jgi:hypothetical protein